VIVCSKSPSYKENGGERERPPQDQQRLKKKDLVAPISLYPDPMLEQKRKKESESSAGKEGA